VNYLSHETIYPGHYSKHALSECKSVYLPNSTSRDLSNVLGYLLPAGRLQGVPPSKCAEASITPEAKALSLVLNFCKFLVLCFSLRKEASI
jgi:hypothetical protein